MNLKNRNFLTLKDYTPEEITYLLDLSAELKEKKKSLKANETQMKNIQKNEQKLLTFIKTKYIM